MKVELAKGDLFLLRRELHASLVRYQQTPASKSHDPKIRAAVDKQIGTLQRAIKRINQAMKQAFGHDCNAYCWPLEPNTEGATK